MDTQGNTPAASAVEPKYLGFWARFIAFIVDSIWVLILATVVIGAILGAPDLDTEAVANDPIGTLVTLSGRLLLDFILVAIAIILFWLFKSATPGKMIFSGEIVDANTFEKPTTVQFIIRYLGYFVSILGLMLGFIWIAFDKRKQGWHDKLAGTVVIKKQ